MACQQINIVAECPCNFASIDLAQNIINVCAAPFTLSIVSCTSGTATLNGTLLEWNTVQRVEELVHIVVGIGTYHIPISISCTASAPVAPQIVVEMACPYTSHTIDFLEFVKEDCGAFTITTSLPNKGILNVVGTTVTWTGTAIWPNDFVSFNYSVTNVNGVSASNTCRINLKSIGSVVPDLVYHVTCPYTSVNLQLLSGTQSGCVSDLQVFVIQPKTGLIDYDSSTGIGTWVGTNITLSQIDFDARITGNVNGVEYVVTRKVSLIFDAPPQLVNNLSDLAQEVVLHANTVPQNIVFNVDAVTDPCGQPILFATDIEPGFGTVTFNSGQITYVHPVPQRVMNLYFNYRFYTPYKSVAKTIHINTVMGTEPIVVDTVVAVHNRTTFNVNDTVYGYLTGTSKSSIKETISRFVEGFPADKKLGIVYSEPLLLKQMVPHDERSWGALSKNWKTVQYAIVVPGQPYTIRKTKGGGIVTISKNTDQELHIFVYDDPSASAKYSFYLIDSLGMTVFSATDCEVDNRATFLFKPYTGPQPFNDTGLNVADSVHKSKILDSVNNVDGLAKVDDVKPLLESAYKLLNPNNVTVAAKLILFVDYIMSYSDILTLVTGYKNKGVVVYVFLYRRVVDKPVYVSPTTRIEMLEVANIMDGGSNYYEPHTVAVNAPATLQNKTQQYVAQQIASPNKFYWIADGQTDPLIAIQDILDHGQS